MATKSILITGCSDGGIGAALAHAFADRDFHVFATARDTTKMASLADRPNVTLLQLDVTNNGHISRAVQTVGGRLDYLVNNAGRNHFMPLLDDSVADAKALFNTNVWGPLALIQAFIPLLIAAKGTIVNITSISGHINIPWMGTYAASKRSLEIISETLRLELRPFDVRVVSVVTGTVKTNGLDYFQDLALPPDSLYKSIEKTIWNRAQGAGSPNNRLSPADYAERVVSSLLANGKGGLLWGPGFTTQFVKFVTAWLPSWILDSLWIKGTGVDEMIKRQHS